MLGSLRELATAVMHGENGQIKFGIERFLSEYDPEFALKLHADQQIDFSGFTQDAEQFARFHDFTMKSLAAKTLARVDPSRARAIIEMITTPEDRAYGFVSAAEELSSPERQTSLEWLGLARSFAAAADESTSRAERLALVGAAFVKLEERQTALEVFRQAAAEARKPSEHDRADYARGMTAWLMAPLDLKAALELVPVPLDGPAGEEDRQQISQQLSRAKDPQERKRLQKKMNAGFERDRYYGKIAHQIAAVNPSEAERILKALGDASDNYGVRVCYRMAPADLPRARRIASEIADRLSRGHALAVIADAISEKDQATAQELLRESFTLLTAQVDEGPGQTDFWRPNPLRIAVSLLPTVERIDPAQFPEYLWRVLSLREGVTARGGGSGRAQQLGKAGSQGPLRLSDPLLAVTIANYDPEIARLLALAPGEGALGLGFNDAPDFLLGAVAMFEPAIAIEAVIRLPHGNDDEIQHKMQAWSQVLPVLTRSREDLWNWLIDENLGVWRIDKIDL